MEKEAFSKLPGWKQINLKKAVGLFQSKKKPRNYMVVTQTIYILVDRCEKKETVVITNKISCTRLPLSTFYLPELIDVSPLLVIPPCYFANML